ncbi:MAG: hypothetical protein RLZZ519_3118 [Bacteroidota bacterium]|jgi:hypothetical protein
MLKLHHLSLLAILLLTTAAGAYGGRAPEPYRFGQNTAGSHEAVSMDTGSTLQLTTTKDWKGQPSADASLDSTEETAGMLTEKQLEGVQKKSGGGWLYWVAGIVGWLLLMGIVGYRHSRRMEGLPAGSDARHAGFHPLRKIKQAQQWFRKWKANSLPYGVSIAIGIFILLFALTGGLFLSNLLLGTIFVGFGWVCLAILIPTVLVGGTMVFLEYYLREEAGSGGGGNTMFQRQASGCGAALAYLLRMIGLCLLALAVSLFLFYGSFALFLTFPVTFGISTTIFVIMAALMIPSTILALQFLRGYV